MRNFCKNWKNITDFHVKKTKTKKVWCSFCMIFFTPSKLNGWPLTYGRELNETSAKYLLCKTCTNTILMKAILCFTECLGCVLAMISCYHIGVDADQLMISGPCCYLSTKVRSVWSLKHCKYYW
jgi:hypothetical protein